MKNGNIVLDLLLRRYRALYVDLVSLPTRLDQIPLGGPVCEDIRAIKVVLNKKILEVVAHLYRLSEDPDLISNELAKITQEINP